MDIQTIILPDGNTFIGQVDNNGLRNGWGVKIYKNSAVYLGTWVNNVRHGKGIKIQSNGIQTHVEYHNGVLKS